MAGIERVIQRTQTKNALWAALLRYYLSPHKVIVKERFTKKAFDTACEMILVKNWQSWVQPGEQVGIIAAQSIGEPSTQMSAVGSTIVHVINVKTGKNFCGPVSEFIDPLIGQTEPEVSSVLRTDLDDYRIVGVSQDEKTSWMPISEVSRHPANGGLVKVTTKSGRTTTATLSHSFLHRTEKGVEAIRGSDLRVGTRVPIATHVAETPEATATAGPFTLNRPFGWLCGIYLADGSLTGNTVRISKIHPAVETAVRTLATEYGWKVSFRDYQGEFGPSKDNVIHSKELRDYLLAQFGVGSYKKAIGADIYSYNREFQCGLLSGYFDGDGNVSAERHLIRVGSRSEALIRHVNRLLSYCGFFGVLGEERSAKIPGKVMHTISILKKYAALFKERIGFTLAEKAAGLNTIIEWMERDGKHDTKEIYDKIPAIGDQIAALGKSLEMPGQSRNYGRWAKKESVGRLTLRKYIEEFAAAGATKADLAPLVSAAYSDVVWDEITALEYLDDPKEFVYDFTVPGNDSFMVDDCILVHNTLNTFHLAGVAAKSNVTRGVPRLKELLKVTHNPKAISLTVYLKPEFRGSKDKARQVAQDLELTLLKDITVKTAIYFDPKDADTVVEEDTDLIKFYKLFEKEAEEGEETTWSGWLLRFEMDRDRMFRKNISMDDVAYVLRTRFGESLHLTYSDYNSNRLIMRMRLPEQMKNGLDDLTNLKKFQNRILNGIVFRGVPGIKSVTFREDKDMVELVDGSYKEVRQYVLDTDGSNYIQVMNHPYVDSTRLLSSHVHDIYEILGIEATRAVLLNEITTLFEEAGVGNRHLGLLCDVMTRGGRLMPSDRHGINKTDIGPLAKASFEETEKILLNAALFGELDPVTGVSANIMTGQVIRGGTGFFNVLLDEGAFMRLQEGQTPVEGYDEDEEGELTQEQTEKALYEDENDMCSSAQLRMNVTIPNATKVADEPDIEVMVVE
jgi:DNA-directed RNA polymerase subunit A"